jgi:hypothetical protein
VPKQYSIAIQLMRTSFLPQTPYRPISTLTPPPFPFLFLPSAINCIQDYYYLILSLLYICMGVYTQIEGGEYLCPWTVPI